MLSDVKAQILHSCSIFQAMTGQSLASPATVSLVVIHRNITYKSSTLISTMMQFTSAKLVQLKAIHLSVLQLICKFLVSLTFFIVVGFSCPEPNAPSSVIVSCQLFQMTTSLKPLSHLSPYFILCLLGLRERKFVQMIPLD